MLAVPICLGGNGFEKVSRNNESIPDKEHVTNPLLSSSCSKKTGMSLGHSVRAAPCCLSVPFDSYLEQDRPVSGKQSSCNKSSQMQLMFGFCVFAIAPAKV